MEKKKNERDPEIEIKKRTKKWKNFNFEMGLLYSTIKLVLLREIMVTDMRKERVFRSGFFLTSHKALFI